MKNEIKNLIIVLGRRLEDDFNPSPMMLERLEKCKSLYLSHENCLIITSGKGNKKKKESQAMREWLEENGIKNVIEEDQSMNTIQNAEVETFFFILIFFFNFLFLIFYISKKIRTHLT